jgi:hypothetical protein
MSRSSAQEVVVGGMKHKKKPFEDMDEVEARVFANIVDRQPNAIRIDTNGNPMISIDLNELTSEERKIVSRFLKHGTITGGE